MSNRTEWFSFCGNKFAAPAQKHQSPLRSIGRAPAAALTARVPPRLAAAAARCVRGAAPGPPRGSQRSSPAAPASGSALELPRARAAPQPAAETAAPEQPPEPGPGPEPWPGPQPQRKLKLLPQLGPEPEPQPEPGPADAGPQQRQLPPARRHRPAKTAGWPPRGTGPPSPAAPPPTSPNPAQGAVAPRPPNTARRRACSVPHPYLVPLPSSTATLRTSETVLTVTAAGKLLQAARFFIFFRHFAVGIDGAAAAALPPCQAPPVRAHRHTLRANSASGARHA